MTAREIITGAFGLVGVYSQGETLTAADAQDALRRLNNMVSSLKTQPLTSLAVVKYIFNLTADQQTYSVGLGGDFNIPRPTQINGAGLLLDALSATQSIAITRSGTTATVTLTAHGFTVGQEVYIAGCTEIEYNQTQVVATVPTADTFTFQVFGSPSTPATGSPTVQTFAENYVEIPRSVLTDTGFQSLQVKNQTNSQFTNVYYNPTQPLGTIYLWPAPTTADNQLTLYIPIDFDGFTSLTTDYTFPDVAGMAEMLEYNLAVRLAAPYGQKIGDYPDVVDFARTSLGLVKRQNYKLIDLPTDALTATQRGGYNINTGNM